MQFLNVLLILTMISAVSTVNPGFQAAVTQKGINYLLKIGVPLLKEEIKTVNIPDMSGKHYEVYGIVLSRFDLGELSLPLSNDGLSLSSYGVSLSGSANWKYKLLFFHLHGSIDMSVDDTTLAIRILVEMGEKGKPTLLINECNIDFEKLNIDFHGDLSSLGNVLEKINAIKNDIKNLLRKEICKSITDYIQNKATAMLDLFPIEISIPKTEAEINYALVSNPTFTPEYMLSQHKGEFIYVDNPKEAPFTPSPLPMPKSFDKMAYIWISPYIIDTAGYAFEEAGLLKAQLNSSEISPDSPFQLTTEFFETIIPEFYDKYPNMNLTLKIYASTPPNFKVTPNEVHLNAYAIVEVNVIDQNNVNEITPAFNLTLSSKLTGNVKIVEPNGTILITGDVNNINSTVSLKDSAFGPFNTGKLSEAVNFFSNYFLIPGVNNFIDKGIEIPMLTDVHFIGPEITLGEDYIMISTDVEYELPTLTQSFMRKRYLKWT